MGDAAVVSVPCAAPCSGAVRRLDCVQPFLLCSALVPQVGFSRLWYFQGVKLGCCCLVHVWYLTVTYCGYTHRGVCMHTPPGNRVPVWLEHACVCAGIASMPDLVSAGVQSLVTPLVTLLQSHRPHGSQLGISLQQHLQQLVHVVHTAPVHHCIA